MPDTIPEVLDHPDTDELDESIDVEKHLRVEDVMAHVHRIDRNFLRVEEAIVKLAAKPPQKPVRRPRTGRAARFDPDDSRATPWLVAGMLAFVVAALAAAFAGQIAMAPYTKLPDFLHWLVPVFIDLPIILLAYVAQVFRRRKQGAKATWLMLYFWTAAASTIQVVHVLSESDILAGEAMTVENWVGVSIMGAVPWILLFSWEQLTKLLVKPQGEKRDPDQRPAARRKPTPRKKATP
jgi:hypothetical protein